MYLAQRIDVEYREKVHEKILRKVLYLFGDGAQIEEGGNGGAVKYREAKEGWRFAADAARITDEIAGSDDRKHTSGGVFVAEDSNLGAVFREEKEQ